MTRILCAHQLAGLVALEATVEIAMRALVNTYPELRREPRPDDSVEVLSAIKLVDQCGALLAALDEHRRRLSRAPSDMRPDTWPF